MTSASFQVSFQLTLSHPSSHESDSEGTCGSAGLHGDSQWGRSGLLLAGYQNLSMDGRPPFPQIMAFEASSFASFPVVYVQKMTLIQVLRLCVALLPGKGRVEGHPEGPDRHPLPADHPRRRGLRTTPPS